MVNLSLGLPVCNGEKYLASTLNSILNQTFENFELIISDNASSDKTEEICKSYHNADKRIKYIVLNDIDSGMVGHNDFWPLFDKIKHNIFY